MSKKLQGSRNSDEIIISDLDHRLFEVLRNDARISNTDLASELGVSRTTATAMIARLRKAHLIMTVCVADHKVLGFSRTVTFGINTAPGSLGTVAEKLATFSSIHHVVMCSGRFGILAWGVFRDETDLLDFVTDSLGSITGVTHYETISWHEMRSTPPMVTDGPVFETRSNGASLDELDFAIIGALQRKSREPMGVLAERLGVSRPTVVRRMNNMLESNVIQFMTWVNPLALGFHGNAALGIKTSEGDLPAISKAISAHRSMRTIATCTGRYNLMSWFIYRDDRDMVGILADLGRIPGLHAIEASIALKTIKMAYMPVHWEQEPWLGLSQESRRNVG